MTTIRIEGDPVFLTGSGRALLISRVRQLRDRSETLLRTLEDDAGETWTVSEHQRVLDEFATLSSILAAAHTVDEVPENPRMVLLGDTVRVRLPDASTETYVVVHPVEAPLEEVRISAESPLGAALLDRRVGDEVEVPAPSGPYRCTILSADRDGDPDQ